MTHCNCLIGVSVNLLESSLKGRQLGQKSLSSELPLRRYSNLNNMSSQTTPDKTVETFQYNFQFRAMVSSCLKETNSPPSPPLMQCCFGLAAQACISCVTANNIAIGEGGESLLICDSKHFCQGECKKIGILVMCLNRFCPRLSGGVFRHSLTVMSITASHCHIFRLHA